MAPEVFALCLQAELNSSPQTRIKKKEKIMRLIKHKSFVPFLKKSLPYLQHSLASRELTIEGVTAPRMDQVRLVTSESDT